MAEPSDAFGGEPDGEPALARPAPSFPIAFASIKPFIGKGDDRGHRSGAGNSSDQPPPISAARKDQSFAHLLRPLHTLTPEAERAVEGADGSTCRAGALDDAELQSGLHRAVAGLTEYVGTILENVRADDQRQDGADRARDAHLDGVAGRPTAEQIRRLRALMLRIAREQDLELSTAAIGWVYFEKLLLKGHVVKGNRKLVAAVCLLLALKINDGRGDLVSRSLQAIQRRFEVSADSVLDHEFSVFTELDFSLWIPRREFMPHFLRMFEATGLYRSLSDYLGSGEFYSHQHA